jgi:hypothetical protein
MAVTDAWSVVSAEAALVQLTGILTSAGIAREKEIDAARRAIWPATSDGARNTR